MRCMMRNKNCTWTGLSVNFDTGEELTFFIWKDGQKMEFTPDEARENFPKLMRRHEQTIMLYSAYGT